LSGIAGYVRATMNPDPDSWVSEFIEWYIEQDEDHPNYGFPIKERAGVLRYFTRDRDNIVWGNSREELVHQGYQADLIKSFTFIPASVHDNKILLDKDPGYLANLHALPLVEREQLLKGNWKIRNKLGNVFRRDWFEIIDREPEDIFAFIRYWDRAGTEKDKKKKTHDPDWTAGVKMGKTSSGLFIVTDVDRFRESTHKVEQRISSTTAQDGHRCVVGIEQDPGQAGKFEANYYARKLAGYVVKLYPAREDKVLRAKPFSSQVEAGTVKIVRAAWNSNYLSELESFPNPKVHDDQVDGSSGAFKHLVNKKAQRRLRIS